MHVRVKRRSRIKSLPPRSQGLDVLIAGVRDQGFSAATAKKAVHAVRDAWFRGLARGEEVDVGCGRLAAVWRGGDPKMVDRKAGTGGRKSTRLNSSHRCISYAVFCLKKK